jgi:hypothetical protein
MNIFSGDMVKQNQEDAQIFWGEIAPCEHVVQIYEDEETFLELLDSFVTGGIRSGDSVMVIATAAHLNSLNERLKAEGFDPFYLRMKEKYITLNAEETLAKFMVNDWPDENLFMHTVSELLVSAKRYGRQARVFGEMVTLLWKQGLGDATVRLEELWNKFCQQESFFLFCAYPTTAFTESPGVSMHDICGSHSKVITGAVKGSNDILYTVLEPPQRNK